MSSQVTAQWAEDVVAYFPGDNASGDCAYSNEELARDCAKKAVLGKADGQSAEIGTNGMLVAFFSSAPIVNLEGEDVRIHAEIPDGASVVAQASRDGMSFRVFTLSDKGLGDLSVASLSDASFIQFGNTGAEPFALDAVEALAHIAVADGGAP